GCSRCVRYAARPRYSMRYFDLDASSSSRWKYLIEFAAQHVRWLPLQDLEDRASERNVTRDALPACLALVVPRLNAVLAIDDVQADGQRIDDARDEAALLVQGARPLVDLDLQTV